MDVYFHITVRLLEGEIGVSQKICTLFYPVTYIWTDSYIYTYTNCVVAVDRRWKAVSICMTAGYEICGDGRGTDDTPDGVIRGVIDGGTVIHAPG